MTEPSPQVTKRMRAVRTSGTSLEIAARELFRRSGARYRLNVKSLPGSPDLANKNRKWAVFVNGCMWHGHNCKLGELPKSNSDFWSDKIKTNRLRDARDIRELRDDGFAVLVIWQCELKKKQLLEKRIIGFLYRARVRIEDVPS